MKLEDYIVGDRAFQRTMTMTPAYEKRHDDPSKDYGIGSVRIRFTLADERGALSWRLSSGWFLPHVRERLRREAPHKRYSGGGELSRQFMPCAFEGMGLELSFHYPVQAEHGYLSGPNDCDLLPGGKCYGDVGFSIGETIFEALIEGGEDAMWSKLEEIHREAFT